MNETSRKSQAERLRDAVRRATKRREAKAQEEEAGLLEAARPNRVRVADVIVPPHKQDLDDDLVKMIVESFAVAGGEPFSAIAVRLMKKDVAGDKGIKIVLVAGAHRLQAAKYAGLEYIDCKYIEGNDDDAKLIELGEDLWRKSLTVLRRAEMLIEWFEIAERKIRISGQDVQKGKVGRPAGLLTIVAGELPAFGRSIEARRKELVRARRIAGISPEAKAAAILGGLANNQTALLAIAGASTAEAQVKKAAEIASRIAAASEGKTGIEGEPSVGAVPSNQKDDSGSVVKGEVKGAGAEDSTGNTKPTATVTLEVLNAAWRRDCRALWKHTPMDVREEFIGMLRRARCHAAIDVAGFIRDIFMGRGSVDCEDLYAFAKTEGLARSAVRKGLKELSYTRMKRKRSGARGKYYYKNKNPDWKDEMPVFKDADIRAAIVASQAGQDVENPSLQPRPGDEGYYEI